MEKQIQASQRFLTSIRSLASLGDSRSKQYTHLRGVIARAASVSTAALADLISSLDPEVWNQEQLEGLKAALAEKVSDAKERRLKPSALSGCLDMRCVWACVARPNRRWLRLCGWRVAPSVRRT